MTLEEAIEHCEERAKICDECGKEHDQLAKWLKEVQQCRKIGTVEECREAVEKQKAKKPKEILRHRGGFELRHCPNCNTDYEVDGRYTITDGYCPKCGFSEQGK